MWGGAHFVFTPTTINMFLFFTIVFSCLNKNKIKNCFVALNFKNSILLYLNFCLQCLHACESVTCLSITKKIIRFVCTWEGQPCCLAMCFIYLFPCCSCCEGFRKSHLSLSEKTSTLPLTIKYISPYNVHFFGIIISPAHFWLSWDSKIGCFCC